MSDKGFHFNHTRKTAVASLCLLAIVLLILFVLLLPADNQHKSTIVSNNTSGWFESIPVDIFNDEKIAPGTEGEHDVSVKNTSNYEMKYELSVYTSEGYIPLEYRVKVEDEYVLGSEQEWLRVTALEGARRSQGSIPSGGKLDLTIEWRWPFESGSDELDTEIGASASQEKLYFTKRIHTDFCRYDFTEENIRRARLEMFENLQGGIKSTLLKLFDEFTREYAWYPESQHNIHYFNGWLTNECHKVGEKVIIPLNGYYDLTFSWGGFKPTRCIDKLADIEKCMSYLDYEQTTAYDVAGLEATLRKAEKESQTKNIKTRYMTLTFYKKGTCHIRFNDAGILQRFNIFGAQQKNWLPPSYGKKRYAEMEPDEKSVIDSFEGAASYEQVCNEPEKYIMPNSVVPALCG